MYVVWLLIFLIVGVNLIILITRKLYIYKGLSATYLRGHLRPSLYDHTLFATRKIKSGKAQKWNEHDRFGEINIPEKFLRCRRVKHSKYENGID